MTRGIVHKAIRDPGFNELFFGHKVRKPNLNLCGAHPANTRKSFANKLVTCPECLAIMRGKA